MNVARIITKSAWGRMTEPADIGVDSEIVPVM